MDKFTAEPASWADSTVTDPHAAETEYLSDSALHRAEVALAAARGEAKGLLIASEMAERACASLWQELRTERTERAALEQSRELLELSLTDARAAAAEAARRLAGTEDARADTEARLRAAEADLRETQAALRIARDSVTDTAARLAETQARLAATLDSHSWRITAPVRWLSARIYRRS